MNYNNKINYKLFLFMRLFGLIDKRMTTDIQYCYEHCEKVVNYKEATNGNQ